MINLIKICLLLSVFSISGCNADQVANLEEEVADLKQQVAKLESQFNELKSLVKPPDGSSPTVMTPKIKEEYLDKVDVYDLKAKIQDSLLDGRVPGVEFKLKNTGDKELSEVEVTVYFMDKDGKVISEEDFYPVNSGSIMGDSKPLKAGYVWRQERGRFFAAKSVPEEWKVGSVKAKVTAVKFTKYKE